MNQATSSLKIDHSIYHDAARKTADLVVEKQAAYGDSFGQSGKVMAILYPEGIRPEQLNDALAVVRVLDKLFRIATKKDAFGESPWNDILGYSLLAVAKAQPQPVHSIKVHALKLNTSLKDLLDEIKATKAKNNSKTTQWADLLDRNLNHLVSLETIKGCQAYHEVFGSSRKPSRASGSHKVKRSLKKRTKPLPTKKVAL